MRSANRRPAHANANARQTAYFDLLGPLESDPDLDPGLFPELDLVPDLEPGFAPDGEPGLAPVLPPNFEPGFAPDPDPVFAVFCDANLDPGRAGDLEPGRAPGLEPALDSGCAFGFVLIFTFLSSLNGIRLEGAFKPILPSFDFVDRGLA